MEQLKKAMNYIRRSLLVCAQIEETRTSYYVVQNYFQNKAQW